jgi:hypothetical protein
MVFVIKLKNKKRIISKAIFTYHSVLKIENLR